MAYGSDAEMTAYLSLTGRSVPVTTTPAIARQYGSQYVDSFEMEYRGAAVDTDASFPRDLWPVTPVRVEQATYEAGYAWASGVAIFGTGGTIGGQVIREKLDVLEVQYAAPEGGYWEANRYILPLAYSLLLPFFKRAGGFFPSAFVV